MDKASRPAQHGEGDKSSQSSSAGSSRPRYKPLAPKIHSVSADPPADPDDDSSPAVDLTFVNFTDPLQSRSQESRKLVRTQVMRNFAREQRKQKTRGNTVGEASSLALRPQIQRSVTPVRSIAPATTDAGQLKSVWLHTTTTPSGIIPVAIVANPDTWSEEVESHDQALKGHCLSPNFRATSPLYMISLLTKKQESEKYPLSVDIDSITEISDPPTFARNLLYRLAENSKSLTHAIMMVSASDLALRQVDKALNDGLMLHHKSKALSLLNEAIQDTQASGSLETLATVVVLACHELVIGDYQTWKVHMLGLSRMLSIKGGISSLEPGNHIRQLILWSDQMGALFMNMRPLFQASEIFAQSSILSQIPSPRIMPQYSEHGFRGLMSWRRLQADGKLSKDLLSIIQVVDIIDFTGVQAFSDSGNIASSDLIDLRNRIIHQLLYLSPQSQDGDDEYSHEECARLTMLLITLDRLFNPILPGAYFQLIHMVADRLAAMIIGCQLDIDWVGHEWVALWICFIGTSVSTNNPTTRYGFVAAAAPLWWSLFEGGEHGEIEPELEAGLSAYQGGQSPYGPELVSVFAADLREVARS